MSGRNKEAMVADRSERDATVRRQRSQIDPTRMQRSVPVDGAREAGAAGAHPPKNSDASAAAAEALLAMEDRVRGASNILELQHIVVEETRKLVAARQVFLAEVDGRGRARVAAVSSLALVERETPMVRWVEGLLRALVRKHGRAEAVRFALPAYAPPRALETREYAFRELYWQPLQLDGVGGFAGLLLARDRPWDDRDAVLLEREAKVFAGMWAALRAAPHMKPKSRLRSYFWLAIAVGLAICGAIPVPMTTLAPVEIVARDSLVIAAPIDGIVERIVVDPDQMVTAGQEILRFEDTELRNALLLAERRLSVAREQHTRASQAAFFDESARHQLRITKTELDLARAERDYAAERLTRTVVRATRAGRAIFADKDKLIGRPIGIGEQLMHIADPKHVEARIDVPVADAIQLERKAAVRLFLDASPLESLPGVTRSQGFHAEPDATGTLVYRLRARLPDDVTPRIGARGTAQVFGATVPLAFFLLRRPISALRQYIGV